ncbi:hypothetical protein CDAR_35301 [Caerostris darwini]|uniref:Uncharacterized protein n=1 Tax=Caerostris darwini TaxID=1538125 RepID=A0AAV4SM97_9ARAC|nr:hypothetical protein CDAR_35301 [Caerostris darwini]
MRYKSPIIPNLKKYETGKKYINCEGLWNLYASTQISQNPQTTLVKRPLIRQFSSTTMGTKDNNMDGTSDTEAESTQLGLLSMQGRMQSCEHLITRFDAQFSTHLAHLLTWASKISDMIV